LGLIMAGVDPGLCGVCRHRQVVETARSRFYLCRMSFVDPHFRKYPVLPVRICEGHEPGDPEPPRPSD
jgi:hypothetical protein